MRNSDKWFPTKYEIRKGKLRASKNPTYLSISSRLMADITANFYQQYLTKYAKGKLIDLGCGNVPFYELHKKFASEVVCVDWPNTAHKNSYLDFEVDLNQPFPIQNEEFDTIIISEVLEHIANPELTWSEMTRILKTDGRIILSVPFLYKIHEAPHDYFRYTEFALKNFAKKNNLTVLELEAFGGLPEVLTDIFAKKLIQLAFIGKGLSILAQQVCRLFLSTGWGKRISKNTSASYPLGYFMIAEKRTSYV